MTPEEARKKSLRFLSSDYDPRLDPKKTPLFRRLYWRVLLWCRNRK